MKFSNVLKHIDIYRFGRAIKSFPGKLRSCLRFYEDANIAYFLYDHYQKLGYKRSILEKKPVNAEGDALPWYTFPAIEYISQIDFSQKRIFEYGAGYSTIFWGKRAQEVISVENNFDWLEKIKQKVSSHIIYAAEQDAYVNCISEYGFFDVIVIDGRFRNACTPFAIKNLREGGMIIVDNSEWCPVVTQLLRDKGFSQSDYHGLVPGFLHCSTTSIFFKGEFSFKGAGPRFPMWPVDGLHDTYGENE